MTDERAARRPTHVLTQWLFLRGLGLIYFCAFVSLCFQIDGLIGSHGILPASNYLASWTAQIPSNARFFLQPTLAWISSSDAFLLFLCWGGVLASLGIIFSAATAPLLVVAWLFYLSLVNVGQDFLSFQWDSLLLEAGFLAIFWCPWQLLGAPWRRKLVPELEPKTFTAVLWLFRWLLFRLMFMSGSVKLLSQDPTWRGLTALRFHYLTQPLPTPVAWVANQLPDWFQTISVLGMFVIELAVPLLFFLPRKFRLVAAALTVFLQLLIMLTGNYTFFNLLTIVLCITLLDDTIVAPFLPADLKRTLIPEGDASHTPAPPSKVRSMTRKTAVYAGCTLVVLASAAQFAGTFVPETLSPVALEALSLIGSYRVVNSYGLFAVMTTTRPEISLEGSDDGVTWVPYVFKYKPGPLNRPPPIIEPFQPRLDWQMWFAALSPAGQSPWFFHFVYQLLKGSPPVIQLLAVNPFPTHPPKFIRANLYDYTFTNFEELQKTGDWWKRKQIGVFLPPVSLDNFRVGN